MSDLEAQTSEVEVLKSIYTSEEEFSVNKNSSGLICIQFCAFLDLPENFLVTFFDDKQQNGTGCNGGAESRCLLIQHLPPIELTAELPTDYPSRCQPKFHLSCTWLSLEMLTRLCQKLDDIWKENEMSEILFIWTQFLKVESLNFLQIENNLRINLSSFKANKCNYIKHEAILEKSNERDCGIISDLTGNEVSEVKSDIDNLLNSSGVTAAAAGIESSVSLTDEKSEKNDKCSNEFCNLPYTFSKSGDLCNRFNNCSDEIPMTSESQLPESQQSFSSDGQSGCKKVFYGRMFYNRKYSAGQSLSNNYNYSNYLNNRNRNNSKRCGGGIDNDVSYNGRIKSNLHLGKSYVSCNKVNVNLKNSRMGHSYYDRYNNNSSSSDNNKLNFKNRHPYRNDRRGKSRLTWQQGQNCYDKHLKVPSGDFCEKLVEEQEFKSKNNSSDTVSEEIVKLPKTFNNSLVLSGDRKCYNISCRNTQSSSSSCRNQSDINDSVDNLKILPNEVNNSNVMASAGSSKEDGTAQRPLMFLSSTIEDLGGMVELQNNCYNLPYVNSAVEKNDVCDNVNGNEVGHLMNTSDNSDEINNFSKDDRIGRSTLHYHFDNFCKYLEEFNEDRILYEFRKTYFDCTICYEKKKGLHSIQFKPCGHVFCKECISRFIECRINDGTVYIIKCPENSCNSDITPSQVREVVGPEQFEKYDKLLLTTTLQTMTDMTICPRTSCQYPVSWEPDEKMATCPYCKYVFCVFCRMVYHGVESCRFKSDEKAALVKRYTDGSDEEKRAMEQRYGKKQLDMLVQASLSETWIVNNSQNCPHCNASIEKNGGCNKMVCWRCSTYFCWICHAQLDPNRPYWHYNDRNSRCYQQLFQGANVSDDEGEDDFLVLAVFEDEENEFED